MTNVPPTSTPNDLTRKLLNWGEDQGYNRYHRKRTQTVVTKDADGNKIRKRVDATDVERLDVEVGIIDNAMDRVVTEVAAVIEADNARQMGAPKKGMAEVAALDLSTAASTALATMMESVRGRISRTRTCNMIGERCQATALREALQDALGYRAKALFKKAQRKYQNKERQHSWLLYKAGRMGLTFKPYDSETKYNVGNILHDAVMVSSGLFEDYVKTTGRGKKTKTKHLLTLSDSAAEAIRKGTEKAQWMGPIYPPMGQRPLPWDASQRGGYPDLYGAKPIPLVRKAGRVQREVIQEALDNDEMPQVIEALNAVQDVPWLVNQKVREALDWCLENEHEPGDSFPPQKEMPTIQVDPVAANDNGDDVSTHEKMLQRDRIEHNTAVRAALVTTSYLKHVLDLIGGERFWLPHNLDFRSRIYPVPIFNYQGADHIKALFLFAEGKVLDVAGMFWLQMHLCSVGDFKDENGVKLTKLSQEERLDWVDRHYDQLIAVGRDFRATFDFWSKADKPFQFLAVCIELANAQEALEQGREYVCRLPVSVDGSCSGYQHYAAAMRAMHEASLVNLDASSPTERPNDIYQFIADKVKAVVVVDADGEDEEKAALAALWLKHDITRKVCKRPVMSSGYNSNAYGFTDQIMTDTMDKLHRRVIDPSDEMDVHPFAYDTDRRGFKAARYLASIIHQQIAIHLSAATTGMEFFKACLAAFTKRGAHFGLTSPMGFPFMQSYTNTERVVVKPYMWSRGVYKRVQVTLKADNDNEGPTVYRKTNEIPPVHPTESLNAVSANLTHMADASHMQMVICAAAREGIDNLMMIHDSFGTLPTDLGTLGDIVRDMFVELYGNYDPFEDLLEVTAWVNDNVPPRIASFDQEGNQRYSKNGVPLTKKNPDYIELPEPPRKGEFDLRRVMFSTYSFA